jgi:excisionase family DNA binding protein
LDELLVDVREAARRLGIGRTEAYAMLMGGELPSVMRGRRRLVAVTDLEEWVRSQPRTFGVAVVAAVRPKTARR